MVQHCVPYGVAAPQEQQEQQARQARQLQQQSPQEPPPAPQQPQQEQQHELQLQPAPRDGDPNMDRVTTWEFYERGGWKAVAEDLQSFIDEQYHLELFEQAGMFLDDARVTKYTWDFRALTQKRWYFDGDVWKVVKTRSIRRVQILSAPSNPVG